MLFEGRPGGDAAWGRPDAGTDAGPRGWGMRASVSSVETVEFASQGAVLRGRLYHWPGHGPAPPS